MKNAVQVYKETKQFNDLQLMDKEAEPEYPDEVKSLFSLLTPKKLHFISSYFVYIFSSFSCILKLIYHREHCQLNCSNSCAHSLILSFVLSFIHLFICLFFSVYTMSLQLRYLLRCSPSSTPSSTSVKRTELFHLFIQFLFIYWFFNSFILSFSGFLPICSVIKFIIHSEFYSNSSECLSSISLSSAA